MTKEELEKATGQELIEQRDYCGVDGYYGDYLDAVNAEMLKRFNRLAELELKIKKLTQHLEPQKMTALFEQVEEEVRQEQRLNELEKENTELKTKKIPQLERKIASIRGAHSVDCKKLNARTEQSERQKKQIFALEKDKAELKAQFWGAKPTCNNCGHCLCENYQTQRKSEPCSLWCSHRDILTKANEIIKNLLTLSIPIDYAKCPGPLQKIAEAEQFLKEVSE